MLVGFVGRVIQNVCSKGRVSNLHLYWKPGREVRCHNELCQLRHVEAETTCQNCELPSRRLETLNPTLSILAPRNLMCPKVSEPDVLALQATSAAAFSHGAEDHSDDADGSACKSLLVRRSFRDLMVGTPSSFSPSHPRCPDRHPCDLVECGMKDLLPLLLSTGIGAFLIGFLLGNLLEGYRWANNAKRIQRLEWRGRLFKVSLEK